LKPLIQGLNRWGKTVLNFCMVELEFHRNKFQNYWNPKYTKTPFGVKGSIAAR